MTEFAWPYPEDDEPKPVWPDYTLRGEYDGDADRIVCDQCDWYETGGPTGCAWAFYDHCEAEHKKKV